MSLRMADHSVSPVDLASLFSLAVVRARWRGKVPTLSEAAKEIGVCRELATRLRARFFEPLVALIARRHQPGPRQRDGQAEVAQKRIALLESLLGLARGIIAAAGIAGLAPQRREEIVIAVEQLHAEHNVSYDEAAAELGLCARTLRRWRGDFARGRSLAPRSRAPQNPHGKLPQPLAQAISLFASLFPSVPLTTLHARFLRERGELCATHGHPKLSYGAFRRCAGREGKKSASSHHTPRRGRDAPENFPPRALALMDTTDIDCLGFGFKLIPFMEAHSRSIFAHQLCDREVAEKVEQILSEGQAQSGGVLALRVDRGSPYLAELTVNATAEQGVEMRVARAYTATDKAILERFMRTVKDALRDVFTCLDLRQGPGELSWRKTLARTIGAAMIAAYLRWGYPYIPQPHIDGRTPAERIQDTSAASIDTIRAALDERIRHHEHAQTVARELHDLYGFRWSLKRWLRAVRGYCVTDLREAARCFDDVLLRGCFNCDARRNPRYLLAIIRTVAEKRRQARKGRRREEEKRAHEEAHRRAVHDEDQQRRRHPEQAVLRALQLAKSAFDNGGLGLGVAQRWIDQALTAIAEAGSHAYQLAAERFRAAADQDPLLCWLNERLEKFKPPPQPLHVDLKI